MAAFWAAIAAAFMLLRLSVTSEERPQPYALSNAGRQMRFALQRFLQHLSCARPVRGTGHDSGGLVYQLFILLEMFMSVLAMIFTVSSHLT